MQTANLCSIMPLTELNSLVILTCVGSNESAGRLILEKISKEQNNFGNSSGIIEISIDNRTISATLSFGGPKSSSLKRIWQL